MEEQKNSFEHNKIMVDLTGEAKESQYTKVLIAEGERLGTFRSFDLVEMDKFKKPNEKESKIVIQIEVQEEGKPVELPLFLTPLVTKAPKDSTNSNSALYDVLDKLGLLQEFEDSNGVAGGFTQLELKTWLKNLLEGKVARVLVQTTKKSKEPYSKIGAVYGFPKDAGVVSEEKEVPKVDS